MPHTRVSRASWTIAPAGSVDFIDIEFTKLNTKRHRDHVKIFEGANGEGALLAVLHGAQTEPTRIRVNATAAYVAFVSNEPRGHAGFTSSFELTYRGN